MLRDRRAMGGLGESRVYIDEVIADLNDKLDRLSRHIDERWDELDSGNIKPWCRLVTVYSQNCVRLGQLMGVRRALREDWSSGSGSGELGGVIVAALDWLSEEWGIEL